MEIRSQSWLTSELLLVFCYKQASSFGRLHIENGNIPTQSSLPKPMIADLMDNYERIKTDVHWIS